jgi:sugar lactone lactonase YvrE
VTVDVKCNVYVADAGEAGNPAVYVYSPSAGTNTTLATFGAASHPVGLAVDAGGNLFVMDGGNDEIYLMAAGGASPTALAGSGSPGSADGATSLSSSFRLDPEWGGMALFANGTSTTLFVTDTGNNTIRALAVAYPAPGSTNPITATVTTPLGQAGDPGSQDGPGTSALFNGPASVAVALSGPALGTAYVADTANNGIRAIVQAAGNGGTGATVTTLKVEPGNIGQVQAVAADGKGNVFVTDSENQAVFQLSPPTDPEGYWSAVQLASPGLGGYAAVNGVAVDGSGNVYVADSGGATVFMIDTSGNLTELPAPEVTDYTPAGVAVDAQGNVYVTDLLNGAVYQISGGVVYPLVGGFTWPVSVAAGAVGTIYVADQGGNEVRQLVITATGTGPTVQSTTLVGQVGVCGTAPGNLPAALANPAGVAVNPDGTLLVTVPDAVLKVQ